MRNKKFEKKRLVDAVERQKQIELEEKKSWCRNQFDSEIKKKPMIVMRLNKEVLAKKRLR